MKIDFIEIPRQVTFDWHITQVMKWLKFDNGRRLDNVLVYAAQTPSISEMCYDIQGKNKE